MLTIRRIIHEAVVENRTAAEIALLYSFDEGAVVAILHQLEHDGVLVHERVTPVSLLWRACASSEAGAFDAALDRGYGLDLDIRAQLRQSQTSPECPAAIVTRRSQPAQPAQPPQAATEQPAHDPLLADLVAEVVPKIPSDR